MLHKIEEVSRNELLALTKGETVTRYDKASGYKGFTIEDIDKTDLLRPKSLLRITCRVGNYDSIVEIQDMLYWIQIVAEQKYNRQVNTRCVTEALMNAIDGLDIKVDCSCADFKYRFAYQASVFGYKYGKKEHRPNKYKRTNKNNVGALCKHLTAMLSNKKWLEKVTGTLMDWVELSIDYINKFLKLKGDNVLTLPNELARQNAKKGFQAKLNKNKINQNKDNEDNEDIDDEIETGETTSEEQNIPDENTQPVNGARTPLSNNNEENNEEEE